MQRCNKTKLKEWKRGDSLPSCMGQIIRDIVDEIVGILKEVNAQEVLKRQVNTLISVSQSFTDLVKWLRKHKVAEVGYIEKQWSVIRTIVLYITASHFYVTKTFIEDIIQRFGDHKFDDVNKLMDLLNRVGTNLSKRREISKDQIEETLQWLCQRYITLFGLDPATGSMTPQFAESLIQLMAPNKERRDPNPEEFVPNDFTKIEISNLFLQVIESESVTFPFLSFLPPSFLLPLSETI